MSDATTPTPTRFLGCDVGKTSIVIFDSVLGRSRTVPNTAEALRAALGALGQTCLLVCEATGGYEDLLLALALEAGCPAHRADARKVKAFIRSLGTLGKTDAIDARALALYAQERHARLTRWQAPDPHRDRLQTLVATRRDLVAQRLACSNRLAAPGAGAVARYLGPLLDCLNAQIGAIDQDIAAVIAQSDELHRAASVLRSMAGLGPQTAAALLGLMPELGRLDRRQAAALAGLAPHPNQSGAKDAYRRTRGGRPEVKRVLFMAALSAARHNPTLKLVYQRLRSNGKKPLVALTAVMRKLIVIANAKLRDATKQSSPIPDI